jgi:NAD(P)H-hydrate epimerase
MGDDTFNPDGQWILTPHAGEFQRLAGTEVDLTDRIAVTQNYAARWNVVLLLKGHPSVVATPDGTTFVGSTGGPALATAGTGDVLAGLCAGFLAQGMAPVRAAAAATHLGGAAADRYATHADPRTMQATDLLHEVPPAARSLTHPHD